jgi:hypothetical protein
VVAAAARACLRVWRCAPAGPVTAGASQAWSLLNHSQHCDVVEESARSMCLLEGAVVGEWSLARPSPHTEDEVRDFARRQVLAYNMSSHGWFFWNWHDHKFYDKWDMEGVLERARLPRPLGELGTQVLRDEWARDPWRVPVAPRQGAAALVSWLGRIIVNPLVSLYDGGGYSLVRRLGLS